VVSSDGKVRVSDRVFRELRHQILTGELSPGDPLPGERVLSRRFGVNRGAVRESLKRLQQSRLIDIQHGEFTRVVDFRRTGTLEVLSELVGMAEGRVDLEALSGLLLLAVGSCGTVAHLAAIRNPDVGHALYAEIERLSSSNGDVHAIVAARLAYWEVLFDGCGDLGHRLLWNSIQKAALPFARFVEVPRHAPSAEVEQLKQIAKAVTEGDPQAAESAVRDLWRIGVFPLLRRIRKRIERGERVVIPERLAG